VLVIFISVRLQPNSTSRRHSFCLWRREESIDAIVDGLTHAYLQEAVLTPKIFPKITTRHVTAAPMTSGKTLSICPTPSSSDWYLKRSYLQENRRREKLSAL